MTAEELANPAMTHLERARAWMNENEADLTSGAWSGLPESLAAQFAQVTNEATAERDATITALKSENEKLREALDALLVRWEECLPSIQNAEKIAHIHGWKYSGPEGGMVRVVAAARAALAKETK